ncbi:potassium/proton antiporter, partial [Mycobacterium tuberculosis]
RRGAEHGSGRTQTPAAGARGPTQGGEAGAGGGAGPQARGGAAGEPAPASTAGAGAADGEAENTRRTAGGDVRDRRRGAERARAGARRGS